MTSDSVSNRRVGRLRWVAIAAAIALVLAMMRIVPIDRGIAVFEEWVAALGLWGPLVFAVVYVLAALAFVPGSLLTLAAGAVFGLGLGTVVVSLASTLTAATAFLIARYLARARVEVAARADARFAAIDAAVGKGGWKIVGLLRLSPAVPFSLSNYLFGLTPVRFIPYAVTSFVAMLPGTFLYVYLGYAGRVGAEAAAGDAGRSPLEWALLAVGLLATVAVTVYVTRLARRELDAGTSMPRQGEG